MGRHSNVFKAKNIPSKKGAAIYIHLNSFTFPNIMNGFAIVMPIVWITGFLCLSWQIQ